MNKIYFIFDFTYDVQFLFDLNYKWKYCGRKENFIENGKQRIFFYISYFNLVHLITMYYYMHLVKITWILFYSYINFSDFLKCG